jgi:uncharacterized protein
MKISQDPLTALTVRQVERGSIRVGTTVFADDFVLTADGFAREFALPEVATLSESHMEPLLAADPELILLGTGWAAAFPPRELVFALARRGVGLEIMDTPAACRTYNILLSEGRRVAAIIKVR